MSSRRLYQVSDLLNNPDKSGKLKFYWLLVFFNSDEELRKEKNELNYTTDGLMSIKKILV